MRLATLILSPLAAVWLVSCGGRDTTNNIDDDPALVYTLHVSSVERDTAPIVSDEDFGELVDGNNRFAIKMFQRMLEKNSDSSVFSPYSVTTALAMTYAGADGKTKAEIADALEFTLDDEALHRGFNKLAAELDKRNLPSDAWSNAQELLVNNAIWPYIAKPPAEPFLNTLARHYGSGIYGLDYVSEPDLSRNTINKQVEEWTKGYIADLLPPGTIASDTRLVLTSAIYLHAPWERTFADYSTKPKPFYNLDGTVKEVPTMAGTTYVAHKQLDGALLAALPFREGQLYMGFLIPDEDFLSYVANLDAEALREELEQITSTQGVVLLPKFQLESDISMGNMLQDFGMVQAFSSTADFGPMGIGEVEISDVRHKAFIDVNEAGTTAAAATAVIIPQPSIIPLAAEINRPFVFFIYDKATKTILFMGHVANF
ncbi:MAG: serpin family protein [Cellvibrionaceae bacterium]|nr:serpin family protein [Cellvibrionaceae bacterium]